MASSELLLEERYYQVGSFRDEINGIREDIDSPVFVPQEALDNYREDCQRVVATLRKKVKEEILEQAKRNRVNYDFKIKLFGGRIQMNPHYSAYCSFPYLFDKQTTFKLGKIHFDDDDGGKDDWGIITNSPELVVFIVDEIIEQLAREEIYLVDHQYYENFSKTQPCPEILDRVRFSIKSYFEDYRQVNPDPQTVFFRVAFFLSAD